MTSAADRYAARLDAVTAQRARLPRDPAGSDRWETTAARFRQNPNRPLDPNLAILAEYVRPDDVLLDIGGGAGRLSLPLALRCREVVNIDPSPAMAEQFKASADEANIANARVIGSGWPMPEPVQGDITLVANVTYFVRDIQPFIEGLVAASRRRVMITVWDSPPPMMDRIPFRIAHGEEQERVPGHQDLLPVLWEMGILPDVRVLPAPFSWGEDAPRSPEEAVTAAASRIQVTTIPAARGRLAASLDRLFDIADGVYTATWRPPMREMLVTWET